MEAADVGLLSQEDIVFTTAKGVIEQTNKYADNLFQIYHIITKNPLAIKEGWNKNILVQNNFNQFKCYFLGIFQ